MRHLKRKYNIVMISLCILGLFSLGGVLLLGSRLGSEEPKKTVSDRDTTAPVIKSDIKTMTIKPGEVLSIALLGLDIQDESEVEYVKFTRISSTKFHTDLPEEEAAKMKELYRKGIALEAEEFIFSDGGIYTITISARDAYYNTGTTTMTVKVEEPPVLEVLENFYVADVVEIDFSEYIKVWDYISEDMSTKEVAIDTEQLQLTKKGSYEIVFTATDEYGLTTSKTAMVHVSSQEDLQEAINTHMIDLEKDVVLGAINAYDSGYYTTDDVEYIKVAMQPCIVTIENDIQGCSGSGFIMEINDEFVTIATSEQVVKRDLTVDVSFFDTTVCSGAVVASSEERDIAFIRIPINGKNSNTSVTSDYVNKLRTVHIDKGYWNKLSENDKEMIVSKGAVSKNSGSAIFDGYGHLIGMVSGVTNLGEDSEMTTVSLEELLQYFEIVFKYKIHYQ